MSSRALLAGFAKSVIVGRHAFVPSRARTVEIGRTADFPTSFDESFGLPAPRSVDAAISAGRWPAALRALGAWARREPGRAEPHVISGVILLWAAPGAGTRPGALEGMIDRYAAPAGLRALRNAVRACPRWTPARLWSALALLRRTDLPAAWSELDELVARRRDWVWPALVRSELARVDILYAKSLRDLDAAERLEPGNAWVHAFRARVLFQSDPGPAALTAIDRAVKLAPRTGWIRAWRADARRKSGDMAGAEADLNAALALEPAYDRIYLWLGKVLLARGKAREAERALTRGLRVCPHFEKAFAARARARFELGQVDAALSDLEAAARINHRHNSLRNWTAQIEPLDEEKVLTIERLARHAAASPRGARAWAWLGEALTQSGCFEQGLAALDYALTLRPRHAWARAWKGEALMRLGRPAQAERELDAALRLDPFYGRANAFRGRVRFLRGRAEGAARDLERSVSDSMIEYSWLYLWRAQAYAACGNVRKSREDERTAAALDPSLRGVA
ncbi:MAG: tetratricopeptide repeat protein [Elusimicrobia bacterium]|nr:tetratricopeptide repeat protein [Elusimicrobiota bacterium]